MFLRILLALMVVALLFVGVRLFASPYTVASGAVSPCLKKGETVILDRGGLMCGKLPERFEIVAIVPPTVDKADFKAPQGLESMVADWTGVPVAPESLVDLRRVIALPNETVVIRKDLGILIDGKLLDESSYTREKPGSDLFVLADIARSAGSDIDKQEYEMGEAPIVVPENCVFVMPDDRKNFAGSDKWSFVERSRIVGDARYTIDKSGIKAISLPKLTYATEKVAINDDGVRALAKGEYTKAIHLFKASLALDDNFELARENLSIAYNNFAIQSIDKPDVAMDSLHRALFLDPNNPVTRKNVAGLLARLGKSATSYDDRLELAEQALKRGKTITALVEFREALKLKPNSVLLARVSQLERKCNFPPHAIPEDEVTARASDNTSKDEPKVAGQPAPKTAQAGPDNSKDESKIAGQPAPKTAQAGSDSSKDESKVAGQPAPKPADARVANSEKSKGSADLKAEETRQIQISSDVQEGRREDLKTSAKPENERHENGRIARGVGKKTQPALKAQSGSDTRVEADIRSETDSGKPSEAEPTPSRSASKGSKRKAVASVAPTMDAMMKVISEPGPSASKKIIPERKKTLAAKLKEPAESKASTETKASTESKAAGSPKDGIDPAGNEMGAPVKSHLPPAAPAGETTNPEAILRNIVSGFSSIAKPGHQER